MAIVLFDVGHTIIDDPFNGVIETMRKEKYDFFDEMLIDEDLVETFFRFWLEINLKKHIPFGSHFMQEEYWIIRAFSRLSNEFNLQIEDKIPLLTPEILLRYRELAKENISNQPQIKKYQRVFQWLKDSRFILGIASDDREFASKSMLKWTHLNSYLDFIFVSEALSEKYPGSQKPNSQFYKAILHELRNANIKGEKIIFIGDSEKNDIVPARNSGMITIKCVKKAEGAAKPEWLDRTEETIADHIFSNPDDLVSIFQEILEG